MNQTNTARDEEPPSDQIDLNDEFVRGYNFMESASPCVFVTGKPGTGKSTLLRYFREKTAKRIAVVAPTGVAAINVGGRTIHSFFMFPPRPISEDDIKIVRNPHKLKLYQALDAIVIDEVSMVRADIMDGIDLFMRKNGKSKTLPFGGTRVIFVGDLFQLSPVVDHDPEVEKMFARHWDSPYFFSAHVLSKIKMEMVELTRIYRQIDQDFIDILGRVRINKCDGDVFERLNRRYQPEFTPKQDDFLITLTAKNDLAAEINQKRLSRLPGETKRFEGRTKDKFPPGYIPTDWPLDLKDNAQVMFVKNDEYGGRWVNGTMSKVVQMSDQVVEVEIAGKYGYGVRVDPVEWKIEEYRYDEETHKLISKVTGSFTQFPLKLAWAISIHKSQGKTFDNVIIDVGPDGAFASGQLYVALSRCRTLGGIVLKTRIRPSDVIVDQRVVNFYDGRI